MESHNSAAAKSNTPTAPDTDMWAHSLNQARKDSATDQVQSTQNSDEEELKIDDVEGITDTMPGVSDAEASSFQEDDSSTSLDVVDSVLVDVSITTEENGITRKQEVAATDPQDGYVHSEENGSQAAETPSGSPRGAMPTTIPPQLTTISSILSSETLKAPRGVCSEHGADIITVKYPQDRS
ncbi:uncharacterized protein MYCGRDRAFT_96847 [Zymoseptoria tritici IPO323]|uniref:Uncharacterized protein n=1 Tax=Zymoseptoria tritici (strain CBS 115943 / IPO323) TaxID=336722 RepID=F9XMA9_ZYMTI|nr:uncharacterized protein MYCGRDRAFT_96847 [Zymoseptoria tritici IPO323]EGP83477.1 hypothetical protein MYCGRDRAFT_96847 [Zymoseptoria tritici IPO323]